jgi:penicillin amidase
MRTWIARSLILLGVLLLVASGVAWFRVSSTLPKTTGTIRVAGLAGAVDVRRDEFGIPHIRAGSEADALVGLGYVHAQDRLWQMEFQRRLGAGRLAELLGPQALPTDRYFRTLGLHRAAQEAWPALSPATRSLVEAYVSGLNAFVSTHHGRALPLEFSIFGFEPEPWTPADVVLWPKVMALTLSTNYRDEILRARIVARAGAEAAAALLPAWSDDWPLIVPEGLAPSGVTPPGTLPEPAVRAVAGQRLDLAGTVARLAGGVLSSPLGVSTPAASNSWVVSGARTSTGKPMLANDPHLGARLPSTWYLAHLEGGRLNVVGATLPGSPGVVIGHNARVAWGLTNLMTDVQDLYVERVNARNEAEYDGAWEPMRLTHEVIGVKGEPSVPIVVRSTRHGPIISDAIADGPSEALALRWVALDPGDPTLDAFLGVMTAANWEEFTVALAKYRVPVQNWVFADVDGNIGYIAPGAIPIRASGDGTLPVPGWNSEHEWMGFVPPEEWPRIYNPTRGFIVTANNKALPGSYPHLISTNWEAGYRAQRITELIESRATVTLDDLAAIQADVTSSALKVALPWLRRAAIPADDPIVRLAFERVMGWDGSLREDSVGASIYMHWYRRLVEALFEDDLGDELWADYARLEQWHGKALHRLVTTSDDSWCDDRRTGHRESCEEVLAGSLAAAVRDMRREYGTDDLGRWTWGRANEVAFGHLPFDAVGWMRRLFSRRAPHHGHTFTVSPTMRVEGQTVIASYRQLIDLADLERSRFVHPLGQSGQLGSAHYADLHDRWRRVEHVPMSFGAAVVDGRTRATLRLEPAGN